MESFKPHLLRSKLSDFKYALATDDQSKSEINISK